MIKLQKGPIPNALDENAAKWTKALLDKIANGEKPTDAEKSKYRREDVKAALVAETNGKCAYCESKIKHIHHGDVEHIYPKSLDPSKSFEWENLTLACEVCNQFKSDYDPYVEHIIDPYLIDPEQHLRFFGGLIYSRGTPHGNASKEILRLQRPALVEQRNEHIDNIMKIYGRIFDVSLPLGVRQAIYDDLVGTYTDGSAAYSAMAKCLVDQMRNDLPADITS
jgi:uncharacterized protein (TIGR02646 family)